MGSLKQLYNLASAFLLSSAFLHLAEAQEIPECDPVVKYDIVLMAFDSGMHNGDPSGPVTRKVLSEQVGMHGASWVRIHFDRYNLGSRSYIILRSVKDDGWQRLDQVSLDHWRKSSAYFNGDAIEISLYVDPNDSDVFFRIDKLSAGGLDPGESDPENEVIDCGTCSGTCSDTRYIPSVPDHSVGRNVYDWDGVLQSHSTSWIISNAAHLTAGHVNKDALVMVEFNVPLSDPDGTPNFSHPSDQYPVDPSSKVWPAGTVGQGNDWAVFGTFPNSNTGQKAVHAQGAFYRLSRDLVPALQSTLRITGYGRDDIPTGKGQSPKCHFCADRVRFVCRYPNSHSEVQQTATGPYGGAGVNTFNASIPLAGGNSGGPLIHESTGIGIGIVTHGGACISNTYLFCSATAQRFTRQELIAAIHEFPGQNVIYADASHPTSIPDGTFFRPFPTIQNAVDAVASGGILSLVEGIYPGAVSINTAMRIEAPVGTVVIGGTGISPAIADAGGREGGSTEIVGDSDNSSGNTLLHNFPNPFNPVTQIEFQLRARSHVELAIFDIMGRKVEVLVNEIKDEGLHQVIFDGSGLATGPYFYRMNVDGDVMTRIMLLIK